MRVISKRRERRLRNRFNSGLFDIAYYAFIIEYNFNMTRREKFQTQLNRVLDYLDWILIALLVVIGAMTDFATFLMVLGIGLLVIYIYDSLRWLLAR